MAVCLPALWQACTLVRIIRSRFSCPLDIEYLEGPHVYHAWRLAHHLPVYADPAAGFATFPYPPLYWEALRGAAVFFGFTVQAGRAVSIAGLLVAAALLAVEVWRAAPSRGLGVVFTVLALGGICAGFRFGDGSYDWTRSDTLAAALLIAAAAAARDGVLSWGRASLVALLVGMSIYTKQSGVVFGVWLIAFAWMRDRRGGLRLLLLTGALCAVPFFVLQSSTEGWFLKWLLYPGRQPLHPWWFAFGALGTFVLDAPFLVLLPWLIGRLAKERSLRPATALWSGMLAVAAASGALMSIKQFTCGNILIPELLLAWPVGALVASDWLARAEPERARTIALAAQCASAGILLALAFDPTPFMATPDRWEAARRLDDLVRKLEGGVVVTTAPMVGVRAGGPELQPILATFEDARSAGMPLDYDAALLASGAKWVITTDRYQDLEHPPETRMPHFRRVRSYPFDLHSLASWDRPKNVVLWQRAVP